MKRLTKALRLMQHLAGDAGIDYRGHIWQVSSPGKELGKLSRQRGKAKIKPEVGRYK